MLTASLRNERDRVDRVDCQDLMFKTLTRFPCNESLPYMPRFGSSLDPSRVNVAAEVWGVARRGAPPPPDNGADQNSPVRGSTQF